MNRFFQHFPITWCEIAPEVGLAVTAVLRCICNLHPIIFLTHQKKKGGVVASAGENWCQKFYDSNLSCVCVFVWWTLQSCNGKVAKLIQFLRYTQWYLLWKVNDFSYCWELQISQGVSKTKVVSCEGGCPNLNSLTFLGVRLLESDNLWKVAEIRAALLWKWYNL